LLGLHGGRPRCTNICKFQARQTETITKRGRRRTWDRPSRCGFASFLCSLLPPPPSAGDFTFRDGKGRLNRAINYSRVDRAPARLRLVRRGLCSGRPVIRRRSSRGGGRGRGRNQKRHRPSLGGRTRDRLSGVGEGRFDSREALGPPGRKQYIALASQPTDDTIKMRRSAVIQQWLNSCVIVV